MWLWDQVWQMGARRPLAEIGTFKKKRFPEHKYSDRFSGYSLFVSGKNPQFDKSLRLARDIGSNLSEAGFHRSLHHAEKIPGENRTLIDPKLGIYQYDDLIVLKLPPIPAALLECGVIVNRHDETELSDPAYVRKMVAAVAKGIVQACQSFGSLEAGK